MSFSVGYWANTKRFTLVHINKDGSPVCGSQIKEDMRYQWCSHGLSPYDYLECCHCKKWWIKNKEKELEHAKGRRV